MDRPFCECHGLPMVKNGGRYYKGKYYPSWYCGEAMRERNRRKCEKGISFGLCSSCGLRERQWGYRRCAGCLAVNIKASERYRHTTRGLTVRGLHELKGHKLIGL